MKKLELEQMEQIDGSGISNGLCNIAVGVAIGGVMVASAATGFGALFVGAILGTYASNAFCSRYE